MLELTRRYPQKRAFITGAGSGLGRALCHALAKDGWNLWMADVREEPLKAAVAEVTASGSRAYPVVLDVTDRAKYQATVKQVLEQSGGMDLLVNNAGVGGGGKIGEYALEDWDWLLSINVMGVVHGCHFFVDTFRKQQSGHIINIASAAALFPVPAVGAYCASKAAVKSLSEVLHNELFDAHVDVTVVMPEFFQTPLHERTRGPDQDRAKYLLERSRYTADMVAADVLKAAGERKLHLVFPPPVKRMWLIFRLAPAWSMKLLRKYEKLITEKYERKRARLPQGVQP